MIWRYSLFLLWMEELVIVCYTFLFCSFISAYPCNSLLLDFSTIPNTTTPLSPQAGHPPLTSKLYPVKYIMWHDTSLLAIQDLSTHQSSCHFRMQVVHSLGELNGYARGNYAFVKLSGFKTCSSAVKPFWHSRTCCLPMNLNGLHLLHSSVYSRHDFVYDLLIKQITVNSFLKTPLPLYQLTFYI